MGPSTIPSATRRIVGPTDRLNILEGALEGFGSALRVSGAPTGRLWRLNRRPSPTRPKEIDPGTAWSFCVTRRQKVAGRIMCNFKYLKLELCFFGDPKSELHRTFERGDANMQQCLAEGRLMSTFEAFVLGSWHLGRRL